MIQYEDFSIKIEPQREGLYPVIVLRSPAGEGRSSFRLPFDPDDLGDLLASLGHTVRSSSQRAVRDVSPAATGTRPQKIGDQLFNALFAGPVRSLLDQSLGMIRERQKGLRIKLHIDPEEASLARLASLPWELLYRKETRDFLNLSRYTPILRYLDVQVPYVPLALEPPLRILVVISSPTDHARLNLEHERAQIERTWAQQENVEVRFLEEATIDQLQNRLEREPFHVLHYMGHGGFDQDTGSGVLLLEGETGEGVPVDGRTLGILLRDVPTLRLVFLNACETARVTKHVGLDPFAGVAAAIVMAGAPAVVAMQFPISDVAAIRFAGRFYALVALGEPVDYAVAEGRRAIRVAESDTMEWATPILFMRAPDGVLFRVAETYQTPRPRPQRPVLDREEEERLEALYIAGLGAFWLEEWDRACHNFQELVDQRPDYKDAAARLQEAERKWYQNELYTQAQAAREAGNWTAVLAKLEELVAEDPGYKDAAALLEQARRQRHLADLYTQARQLHEAAQWPAVVRVFAQIAALEPDYPDPDDLLATAKREAEELERQAALSNLHRRAVLEMDAGHWAQAQQLLTELLEMEPGYRQAERLLARVQDQLAQLEEARRRQEQVAALYDRAASAAEAGQWAQALARMDEIGALEPEFPDPQDIVAQARAAIERQERLQALYEQARTAYDDQDWPQARTSLQALVEEDAGYRDAANLLAAVEAQIELDGLYAQARQEHQAGEWQAVVDTFARIATLEPAYPDPEGLLPAAEGALAEQRHRAELDDLYGQGVQAMDAGQWTQARALLAEIQEREPGYRGAERLLDRVEAEIEQAEADRQRQEQIATLYEQAQSLARARQWRPALAKMDEIQALDAGFADPEGIAARARERVAEEETEAQRQNELAALYAEAVRLLKADQYQEALEKWGEVQTLDPRYRDRKKVQATARKKLARLAKPAAQPILGRRLSRWAIVAIGGFAVVAVAAIIVLLGMRPTLNLRVCYDCDWVASFYKAGHTVSITVTESDGVTVKAKAEVVTEPRDAWGGEPGFQTQSEDWDSGPPDIQPHDWVYGSVDNGASAQMQIGEITGMLDLEADTIEGTVNAPWLSDEVNVECYPWAATEPAQDVKSASVLPDGEDTYSCSWAGEWNIQPGQGVDVHYIGSDGHLVLKPLSANSAIIVASSLGDWFWTHGYSPYASLTVAIYESKDGDSALLWEGRKTANEDGFAYTDSFELSLTLQPGNYLTVSDGVVKKGLVLESITMDTFDVNQDLVTGTAPPGRDVLVVFMTRGDGSDESRFTVTADPESGVWTADKTKTSLDITEQMQLWSFAQLLDDDGDATETGTGGAATAPAGTAIPADTWGSVTIPPGDTVKLAFVAPLTGEQSSWGDAMRLAFAMVIEEAGSIQGFPLEAVFRDGGCEESLGEETARELASDESIVGVVGHACSSSCRAGMPSYDEAHLVTVSPSCVMPDLTGLSGEVFSRVAIRNDVVDWETDLIQVASTDEYQAFADSYQAHYDQPIPEVPTENGSNLAVYAAHTYDAANILIQSIWRVAVVDASGNLVIGRQALAQAVRSTADYPGVTGTIGFDENGDRVPPDEGSGPQPTSTPEPTPLPGTEVVPISQMAPSIPWLSMDRVCAVQTISFNVTKAPFDDRRARQAFSMAVNRATAANIASSFGVIDPRPATTFTHPEVLGRDLYQQVGLVYDPGRARQLLAEAGYPNGDGFPQVTLFSSRIELYEALVNDIADHWRDELGVKVNVELVDGRDAWLDRLNTDTPEVFRIGWPFTPDRDPKNLEFFRSGHKQNVGHFSSSDYDRLIDEAAAMAEDPLARQALYIEAEWILCEEEAGTIPLYHYYTE